MMILNAIRKAMFLGIKVANKTDKQIEEELKQEMCGNSFETHIVLTRRDEEYESLICNRDRSVA